MEGALDTATAAMDFARAEVLDLGIAGDANILPLGVALAFAFILGIASFAKAAMCAVSKK